MRALMLLRAARAAAAAVEPFGSLRLASEACGTSAAPLVPVSQLTSLLGMQFQQQAAYAARHRGDDSDEDDEAAATGRHSKLTHSQRKLLIDRKLREGEEREPVSEEEDDEDRVRRIMETLGNLGHPTNDNASSFVSRCAAPRCSADACRTGCCAGQAAVGDSIVLVAGWQWSLCWPANPADRLPCFAPAAAFSASGGEQQHRRQERRATRTCGTAARAAGLPRPGTRWQQQQQTATLQLTEKRKMS